MLFLEMAMIFVLSYRNGIEIFFRGDGRDYQNLANNLIYLHTFAITNVSPFVPTNFRTPIYPVWLALITLFFKSFTPAVFIGAAIFALSSPLSYLIGREIFSEKIAFISALIATIEPWAIYQAGFLAAEQIFLPGFLLSMYLFCLYLKNYQVSKLYWSSFFLAIAALTRPISLYFIVILVGMAFIFEFRRSLYSFLKVPALAFLIFILVLSPWFIRNKVVLNSWQFSSASSLSIFGDYLMLEKYIGKFSDKDDIYERAKQITGAKTDIESFAVVENSKKLTNFAVKGIISHPISFLAMHFLNSVPLFLSKNSYSNIMLDLKFHIYKFKEWFNNFSLTTQVLIILSFFWPIIIILSFAGICRQFSENRYDLFSCFLILWILYFTILAASARDISRYRLAIHEPIFLFAIYGFYTLKNYFINHVFNS